MKKIGKAKDQITLASVNDDSNSSPLAFAIADIFSCFLFKYLNYMFKNKQLSCFSHVSELFFFFFFFFFCSSTIGCVCEISVSE